MTHLRSLLLLSVLAVVPLRTSMATEPAAHASDPGEDKPTAQAAASDDAIPESAAAPYRSTQAASARTKEITANEINSFLRIGDAKTALGDYDSAEIAYRQVLAARATPTQDRDALLGLARMYRRKNQLTRAAAVYEKLLKECPVDSSFPIVYLELGRVHRALGAYKLAIARFYSVINSTLKLPEEGSDLYRQLARTAQFEVAETYFLDGQYQESARFFSRLKLLDLTPADQARAHFKSAFALNMAGDYEKTVANLRSFLEQYPNDENAPEARYLLSISLRRLNRNQESLAAALDLLKTEHGRTSEDPKRWAYWQRKTGNQLANEFYEQGDTASALSIYLSLASLSDEPSWRLPILYQVALCYGRLRSEERAREYLQIVVTEAKASPPGASSVAELTELAKMATWRLQHLDWEASADRQLNTFFQTSDSLKQPATGTTLSASPQI